MTSHMAKRLDKLIEGFEAMAEELKGLRELERLCIDFIRALEYGDEYDKEMGDLRDFVTDRHPEIIGGGKT